MSQLNEPLAQPASTLQEPLQEPFHNQSEPAAVVEASLSDKPLRVLQIHNFYQQRGGEDVVVQNEAKLLQQAGVALQTWYVDSASLYHTGSSWIGSAWKALQLLGRLFWNTDAQRHLTTLLQQNPVDVIHLHNSFPLLSPAIIHTAKQLGVPLVLTVHNFRWHHPTGCIADLADIQRSPWRYFGQRLYRQSRFATALMICQIQLHRWLGSYQQCQKLICPSTFVQNALLDAGFALEQLWVKPHSVSDDISPEVALEPAENVAAVALKAEAHSDNNLAINGATYSAVNPAVTGVACPSKSAATNYALYVGRADAGKGLWFLLQAWQQLAYPLWIVGVTEQQVQQWPGYQPNPWVHFAGQQTPAQLRQFYQHARLLLVPSLVAETFGNVVIEAFSHGLPCVVSDAGALPELVQSRHNSRRHAEPLASQAAGEVFVAGDTADFVQKVTLLFDDPARLQQMSQQARQQYMEKFLPQQNLQALLACYHQVLAEQGKVVGG
jgi:glycosyltransferase involved in cell wall biosynthesis